MSGVLIRRPWDRQPQEYAPAAADIPWTGLWLPSRPGANLATGGLDSSYAAVGATTVGVGGGGVAWSLPSASGGTARAQALIGAELLPTQGSTIFLLGAQITTDQRGAFGEEGTTILWRMGAHIPFSDGVVYFDFGGATNGTTRVQVGGLSFSERDVWCFSTGPRGMEIWQNGIKRASNGANPTRSGATRWGLGGNNTWSANAAGSHRWYACGLVSGVQLPEAQIASMTRSHASFYSAAFETRRILVPVPAVGGAPTLSDLQAASITASTVQGTYDYAF